MDAIQIQGGIPLQGNVRIQGSKNAVLPVLAATLLTQDTSYIKNCPKITDVQAMIELLECLGCRVHWQADGVVVDTRYLQCGTLPEAAVRGMRSSLFLLGALLGRCREVCMEYPGGCVIGKRPIDLHIYALERMGVTFEERGEQLHACANHLKGAYIRLPIPSVGVTENVILAGVMAEGDTYLEGAAKEPEIVALCEYLTHCGAKIEGAGSEHLIIRGGSRLFGTQFQVPADRIVAGTYLFACIGTGGSVLLEKVPVKHMKEVFHIAERMGGYLYYAPEGVYVQGPERPAPVRLETAVYPGFPTDLQSMVLTVETLGKGESVIAERIFENRFRIVEELRKMGADITLPTEAEARVRGVETLQGCELHAKELRGGASLVIAGLMAEGSSVLDGVSYIYRGYENICRDFMELGARVASV